MSKRLDFALSETKNNTAKVMITEGILSTTSESFEFSIFDGQFQQLYKDFQELTDKIRRSGLPC